MRRSPRKEAAYCFASLPDAPRASFRPEPPSPISPGELGDGYIQATRARNDIGGISTPIHPDTGKPQVFIHDGHPGGVGISEHGYDIIEELWEATLEVIKACPCETGCPGCIQSPKCGNNNQPLDKQVAKMILRGILGRDGQPEDE